MRRKNLIIDRLADLQIELDRLYAQIPEDTSAQYDFWMSIIRQIKKTVESVSNLVELEEDE